MAGETTPGKAGPPPEPAQGSVKAMNLVNATGSAVANGINIARTSGLSGEGAMNLQQSNVISHSR